MVPSGIIGIYTTGILIGVSVVGLVAIWWAITILRGKG